MKTIIRPALVLFAILTLICCVIYPYVVTGIAQTVFPNEANGSLVRRDGKLVGSSLIGQSFSSPKYFWSRPSATAPMPNNASASSGSNQGPANPALVEAVKGRVDALKAADPDNTSPIPVDLVTASASGLDPEISLAAAYYQADRVARIRQLPAEQVRKLIQRYGEVRMINLFGEPRVNVLALNMALDQLR